MLTRLPSFATVIFSLTALGGCDAFFEARYVPAGTGASFSASRPVDETTLVQELGAFGQKYGMECRDSRSSGSKSAAVYYCYGKIDGGRDGAYSIVDDQGYPQIRVFTIGHQMFLLYPHESCDFMQAAQNALESFTGPLKLDNSPDYCAGSSEKTGDGGEAP